MYILYCACGVWFITPVAKQHNLFTTYQTFGVLIFRNFCSQLKCPLIHIEQFGCIIFAKEKPHKKGSQSNEASEVETIKYLGKILTSFAWKHGLLSLICLAGGECVIFIPWYLTSDHVLCLNDNGVEELFKMAFHSGSWWMFCMLERQPTWGLLKRRSVKQSARIMQPHVLIRHPNHPFVNMIILANSRVKIIVFNLLVDCAAEWVK